jgi:predicted DNA-binding protein (UPF0251 family)
LPARAERSGPSRRSAGADVVAPVETSYGQPPRPLDQRLAVETRTALALAFASGVKQKELARKYEISIRSVKRLVHDARKAGIL